MTDMVDLLENLPLTPHFLFDIIVLAFKGGFPSGQRGQTVTLLAKLSKVRILLHPLVSDAKKP